MISQRDIAMFFHVIDVLGNPEKAKAELQTLINMREAYEKEKASFDDYVKMTDARVTEANAVLKNQKDKEVDLAVKEEALVKAQQQVAKDKTLIEATKKSQLEITNKLNAFQAELDTREKSLNDTKDDLLKRSADYAARMDALRVKEADYQKRMEKLRSISA